MPAYALHPQSLLMETTWVCQWFTRLLKKMTESKAARGNKPGMEQVFIADRSPFSACFYSRRGGGLLDPVIREQIKEVREAAGIEVYTVYVNVEKEVLWDRIQNRLQDEPERKKYDEDKREVSATYLLHRSASDIYIFPPSWFTNNLLTSCYDFINNIVDGKDTGLL